MARYQLCRFAVGAAVGLSLALALAVPALQAQNPAPPGSRFVFPRFVAFDDISSGIAIFNPANREAVVQLSLSDGSGALLAPPRTIRVPALGQVALTAAQIFGAGVEFDAVLTVTSSVEGLVAYYQTFDGAASFVDGADAPPNSFNLIFPVIPGEFEGASEIDLYNPNVRPAAVDLRLWSFTGELLAKSTVSVPGGGIVRGLASDHFPAGTSFGGSSHVTATCRAPNIFTQAQSVYGTSLFVGFYPYIPPGGTVDLGALNAVSLEQTTTSGVIPHFRTGPEYASTLSIVNAEGASPVDVTVTAIGEGGQKLDARKISLAAGGGYRAPLQWALPALGGDDRQGWLLLQATGRITAAVMIGATDQASLGVIRLEKSPKFEFVVPQLVVGAGGSTELALSNPGSSAVLADVYVVSPSGNTVASNQVSLAPGGHSARKLEEIIPELGPQSGGAVYVRASSPVFGTGLIWSPKRDTVTAFAPQSLTAQYVPAPITSFAVTGRVTLNDRPAPGFRVVLSGPSGGVKTTAEDGTYIFTALKPGRYSMSVDQYGFEFFPPQANFELKTASRRQDFVGSTSTAALVVQPSALPVGAPATTVAVFGRDFNSSSTAYVGNVPLTTTYVEATRLDAVVPAYMLAKASRFEIVVATETAPGQYRYSKPFGMVAYLDRPTVSALVTAAPVMEGSAQITLTVRGSGFLAGARLKVNGSSDGIQITQMSDVSITAEVPPQYFEVGGIYPVTVENPYPANVESNIQLLTVYNPAPVVEALLPSVVPARLEAGAGPLKVDVLGFGFRRGAVVLFDGVPLSTIYCESDPYCLNTHIAAMVPAALLRESGFATIQVKNADPSLGGSEAALLRIDGLVPTISSVVPGSGTAMDLPQDYEVPVIVNGTNFGPQTLVRAYKADASPLPPFGAATVLSSSQLLVNIDVTYPDALGEWVVEVMNPPPAGGMSEAFSFFISEGTFAASPFIISMTPEVVGAGGPGFTLVVNGSNFKDGSVVLFYSKQLQTTFVSDRQLWANVPASLLAAPGRIPVTVLNPDSGGASNRVFIEIR